MADRPSYSIHVDSIDVTLQQAATEGSLVPYFLGQTARRVDLLKRGMVDASLGTLYDIPYVPMGNTQQATIKRAQCHLATPADGNIVFAVMTFYDAAPTPNIYKGTFTIPAGERTVSMDSLIDTSSILENGHLGLWIFTGSNGLDLSVYLEWLES